MRRVFDIILVFTVSPVAIPLILLCSIALAVLEGRPIFYGSKRLGKNQQLFTIYKFRTMSISAPLIPSNYDTASVYVTKLGKFLRLSSLDELPQLLNILNGTMTFIGPRPCLASEQELIIDRTCKNIFLMTPGLTGLAQVRGRDKNSIRNKVRYETFYQKKSLCSSICI